MEENDEEPQIVCPWTGTFCDDQFCGDYGCAKDAGINNDDDDIL